MEEHVEKAVCKIAIDQPALGQQRVSNELRKTGIFVSGGGVRSIWQRHGLETFKKRLRALEADVAANGTILTEAQLAALEKKQEVILPVVRLKPLILATWVLRTPSLLEP